jgi:signal transduction histidine kinase
MSLEDERKFLHDVANPLSIAHGNLKIALRKMEGVTDKNAQQREVLERLHKAIEACEKIAKQLGDRRKTLMDQQ